MTASILRTAVACVAVVLPACSRAQRSTPQPPRETAPAVPGTQVRIAVFNTSLTRDEPGRLRRDLEADDDPQAKAVAAIVQRVRPDVLLLLEVDRDPDALALFERRYLAVAQPGGADGLVFAHRFVPPTNTGTSSGFDLDRDGRTDGPGDAWGFGRFPGQYGMVVLSRYPLERAGIECMASLLWRDLDGTRLPDDPDTTAVDDWYAPEALQHLPVSSKNHCVVPIVVGEQRVHLLASHPVPPVFDGAEDRNGLRNHEEIRLWARFLDGTLRGISPLGSDAQFVVAGDLNADPHDGDATDAPISRWLTGHPRIRAEPVPHSAGGVAAASRDGGINATHRGPAMHDTADFPDTAGGPGNLRTDYVLASASLEVVDAGVFWPAPGAAGAELVGCSDHRLVWIDVVVGTSL